MSAAFDERAAEWWLRQRRALRRRAGEERSRARRRASRHLHPLDRHRRCARPVLRESETPIYGSTSTAGTSASTSETTKSMPIARGEIPAVEPAGWRGGLRPRRQEQTRGPVTLLGRRGLCERRILAASTVDRDRAARMEAAPARDATASGVSPRRICGRCRSRGSRCGTTESSAFVYGCCGFRTTAARGPFLDDAAEVHDGDPLRRSGPPSRGRA